MKFRPVHALILVLYFVSIAIGTLLFGVSGGAIAGVVAPALTFLVNAINVEEEDATEEVNNEKFSPSSTNETFVKTFPERKASAKSELSDYIELREFNNGDIELQIHAEDIRGVDREAMLYVFGQWAKADEDSESSPVVTKHEIRQNTELKGGAVGVFLTKMDCFIERHYPKDPEERMDFVDGEIVRMPEEEMRFELNEEHLEEIVDYILGDRGAPN